MEGMEKQLTAVGWLESLYYPEYIPKHIIEQAKEMEKKQIKDARYNGRQELRELGAYYRNDDVYYEETFKSE